LESGAQELVTSFLMTWSKITTCSYRSDRTGVRVKPSPGIACWVEEIVIRIKLIIFKI